MAYITITEDDVITKLSGPELAAMKSAALQAGQVNPLPEIITQVVGQIRGYVAACQRNVLGAGETIPNELLNSAINRIRYELATRLPVESLLTQARVDANAAALTELRDVAACRFLVVQPETIAAEQVGTLGPTFTRRSRSFDRTSEEGV